MFKELDPETEKKWQELLAKAETPDWIQEMHRHYRRTGRFRPEDLRRLLGDPNQGVEIGPNASLSAAMAQLEKNA